MTDAHFPSPIRGYFMPDDRRFTLETDFIYIDQEKDLKVVVPAGFTTDWNSVPHALWTYMAPWEYPEAGLVHDWLYTAPWRFKRLSTPDATPQPLTKGECDDIHRRILDLKGCRWTKRQTIWLGLRVGAAPAWNKHRRDDPPKQPCDDQK